MRPELLRAGAARIHELFAADKALGIYRHRVDNTLRMAPHTLDAKGENLVATSTSRATRPAPRTRSSRTPTCLADATARGWGGDQARPVRLNEVGREAPNRDDRKRVFDAFWGQWKEFERTCGVMFHESLKKDTVYTRVAQVPARSLACSTASGTVASTTR